MLAFIRGWIYKIPVLNQGFKEVILEALRFAVLAFVSTLLTVLLNYVKTVPNPEVWVITLTFLLRAIDKYKYVENKDKKVADVKNLGLVGF